MDGRIALVAGIALIIAGVAFAQAHPWQDDKGYGNYSMGFHAPGLNESAREEFKSMHAFNATVMAEYFQDQLAKVSDPSLQAFMQEHHDLMLKAIDGSATEEELIALGGGMHGFKPGEGFGVMHGDGSCGARNDDAPGFGSRGGRGMMR